MKKLLLLLTILTLGFTIQAQVPDDNKRQDVQAIIVAYITKKLDLTVDEAQKFWPVFNNYSTEFRSSVKGLDNDEIKRNEAIVAVQKKYKLQFQSVLGSEQRANKVFRLQRDVLQKLKDRKQNRPQRAGAGRRV